MNEILFILLVAHPRHNILRDSHIHLNIYLPPLQLEEMTSCAYISAKLAPTSTSCNTQTAPRALQRFLRITQDFLPKRAQHVPLLQTGLSSSCVPNMHIQLHPCTFIEVTVSSITKGSWGENQTPAEYLLQCPLQGITLVSVLSCSKARKEVRRTPR